MKIHKTFSFLFILFLFVFITRLMFTLPLVNYSSDEAYFHLRSIMHIVHEKTLLTQDPLSYGGRPILYSPLYHILMAFLTFGSPLLLKILPELFSSSIVFIAYLLCKEITDHDFLAFAGAAFAALIPMYWWETLNVLSIYSLLVPLLFSVLYAFIKIDQKKYALLFLVSILFLTFLHPSVFLLLVTFLVYFFLLAGGALTPSQLEKEAVLASFLSIILIHLLYYARAFSQYGFSVIWQNIPAIILADSFRALQPIELILAIGILPLLLGFIALYFGITKEKKKSVYILSAFMLANLLLIALRLITLSIGLMFLGISLAILSPLTLYQLWLYLEKTRFSFLARTYIPLLAILIFFFSVLPTLNQTKNLQSVDPSTIIDLTWARTTLPQNATILGNVQEGHLITAIAERANVIDSNFLLAPDPLERLKDVDDLYHIVSSAKANQLLKKYHVTAIYFSPATERLYSVHDLKYTNDACFQRDGRFYLITC